MMYMYIYIYIYITRSASEASRVEGVAALAGRAPQLLAVREVDQTDHAGGVLPDVLYIYI